MKEAKPQSFPSLIAYIAMTFEDFTIFVGALVSLSMNINDLPMILKETHSAIELSI